MGDVAHRGVEDVVAVVVAKRVELACLHVDDPHERAGDDRRSRRLHAGPSRRETVVGNRDRAQLVVARDEHERAVVHDATVGAVTDGVLVHRAADTTQVRRIEQVADARLADLEHASSVEQHRARRAHVAVGRIQSRPVGGCELVGHLEIGRQADDRVAVVELVASVTVPRGQQQTAVACDHRAGRRPEPAFSLRSHCVLDCVA